VGKDVQVIYCVLMHMHLQNILYGMGQVGNLFWTGPFPLT